MRTTVPEPGQQISHYRLISALGSGGMGEVYLAEDTKLGRRIALKFLSPELASDSEHLERFVREARSSSALNHPNICTVYEINDHSETPFIAMEYIEGETVAEMIRRRHRNVRQAVEIMLQIAEAMAEAHLHGVIHRDIKPANIMVDKRGRAKILDFGLAKRAAAAGVDAAGQFQTHAGVVLGTASYMSPEQARGLEVDNRSDIWSLGVCLYEMLTRSLPFAGDSAADTFAAILTREPVPPSEVTSGIPRALDRVVMRSMQRERERRYQTVEEMITDLRAVKEQIDWQPDERAGTAGKAADEPTEVFDTAPTEQNAATDTDEARFGMKTVPNNLTAAFERIIGREAEIAAISEMLLQPDTRLVTMTGIGGTGKTTLSRAVARNLLSEFADGVYFIEMADISRADVVASTIAQPLGIKEEGGRAMLDVLKIELAGRKMLLVIDNFEQVIDAASQIGELLAAAPGLKVLVTSRELLRITPEIEYQVPPLSVPEPAERASFDELRGHEAILLFAERAKAARPAFSLTPDNIGDVVAICARLDGLPLAIELAAARVKILSPAAVLAKLEHRLDLLTGGARDLPERQKTMRGAVMWSYDLLTPPEQAVFRELSVFSGGFRIDSAEFVCSEAADAIDLLDILASLIDKSLVVQKETPDGEPRFRMLEVVRDFALEMLETAGGLTAARLRHAEFFVDLGETAEPLLQGADSPVWLAKLEEEHDNLRAAMGWSLENRPELAVRLAVAIRNYWLVHSHLSEGFGWLKAASETEFKPEAALRFKLLNGLGLAARFRGDFVTARRAYEDGLSAGIEAGDKAGTALSNRGLGLVAMQQGDFESAHVYFDAGLSISRELGDKYGIAMSLSFLGDLARTEGRNADARPQFEEAAGLFRQLENTTAVSDVLNNLGAAEFCLGETARAAAHFSEALTAAQKLGNRITTSCSLDGLAAVAAASGEPASAARLAGAADNLRKVVGYEIEPAEARFREHYLSKLREQMPESDFERFSAEGAELSLESAVNEALERAESISI